MSSYLLDRELITNRVITTTTTSPGSGGIGCSSPHQHQHNTNLIDVNSNSALIGSSLYCRGNENELKKQIADVNELKYHFV
jgi:hypothetical protein